MSESSPEQQPASEAALQKANDDYTSLTGEAPDRLQAEEIAERQRALKVIEERLAAERLRREQEGQ